VLRFEPANEKTAYIQLTTFKSFDNEGPSFYFGSMPLFIYKISCKSARKNLNAIDHLPQAFSANIAVEQEMIVAAITTALFIFTLF